MSGTRIYVGNLPFSATEESLVALFSSAGEVTSATIARRGNASRGFGFVEFASPASVETALGAYHGKEWDGRTLRVEAEQPKTEEERAAARERRRAATAKRRAEALEAAARGEGDYELSMRVYVGNLPYDTDSEALAALFGSAPGFVSAEVAADRDGRGSRGFGYVTFDTEESLNAAVARFSNTTHGDRTLTVERELPKQPRTRRRRGRGAGGAGAGGAGAGGAGAGGRARGRRARGGARADAAPADAPKVENNPAKVYVGNVPFDLDVAGLADAFSTCGTVELAELPERNGGHKLGFGYVTFASADAADRAVETLNGSELGGRTIRVEKENRKPRTRRPRNRNAKNRRRRNPEDDE